MNAKRYKYILILDFSSKILLMRWYVKWEWWMTVSTEFQTLINYKKCSEENMKINKIYYKDEGYVDNLYCYTSGVEYFYEKSKLQDNDEYIFFINWIYI